MALTPFSRSQEVKNVEKCLVFTLSPDGMDGFSRSAQINHWEMEKNFSSFVDLDDLDLNVTGIKLC